MTGDEPMLIANSEVPNPRCCNVPGHLCPKCQKAQGKAVYIGDGNRIRILNQRPFDPTDIEGYEPPCAADLWEMDEHGNRDEKLIANRRAADADFDTRMFGIPQYDFD